MVGEWESNVMEALLCFLTLGQIDLEHIHSRVNNTLIAVHFGLVGFHHLHTSTVCALIFTGFNVRAFCGVAAICKSFYLKIIDFNGYTRNNGQPLRI